MQNNFERFEFKYKVPREKLSFIQDDCLRLGMQPDPRGFYTVSSLYFDTPLFLSDYSDKAGGFISRKKIRARIYAKSLDEADGVWLEIKEKYDMMIYKQRVRLSVAEWHELLKTYAISPALRQRLSGQEFETTKQFLFQVISESRRPHLLVEYQRRPFFYRFGSRKIRLTLDYDIRSSATSQFHQAKHTMSVLPGRVVLELKYASFLPGIVRLPIHKYNLQRDAYSKYALGVEAVRWFNRPAY